MKIRSVSELEDLINEERAWRQKELIAVRLGVARGSGSNPRPPYNPQLRLQLRAAVAILYAHWEGWVKQVARYYIEFVNTQRPSFASLSAPLAGAAMRSRLLELGSGRTAKLHAKFGEFVAHGGLSQRARIDPEDIRTDSNLGSTLFEDILIRLGIPVDDYETHYNLIDTSLVQARNSIAHGDFSEIEVDHYLDLHDNIVKILRDFTTDVLNAAATRNYLRDPSPVSS